MKVLVLTTDFPPEPIGGIGTFVASEVAALRRLGVDVTVVTSRVPASGSGMDGPEIRIKASGPNVTSERNVWSPLEVLQRNVAIAAATLRLRDRDFDVVHAHDFWACIAGANIAAELDVPLVVTKHSGPQPRTAAQERGLSPTGTYLYSYLVDLERWMLDRAAHVIAVSDDVSNRLAAIDSDQRWQRKCTKVKPATDIHDLAGIRRWQPPRPDRNDEYHLLLPGRTRWVKGGDLAIRAIAALPHRAVRLLFAGGDPTADGNRSSYVDELKELAAQLNVGDRVEFLGNLDQERLVDAYLQADSVIVPSRQETFGLVVTEALALGVPVIAFAVGGIAEQIEHEVNGLLARPEDVDDLAAKIEWSMRHPVQVATMAKAGLSSSYTWEDGARLTLEVYKSVTQ